MNWNIDWHIQKRLMSLNISRKKFEIFMIKCHHFARRWNFKMMSQTQSQSLTCEYGLNMPFNNAHFSL
jgi:hypothetical protein